MPCCGGHPQVGGHPLPVRLLPLQDVAVHEGEQTIERRAVIAGRAVGSRSDQRDDGRVEPLRLAVREPQLGLLRRQQRHQGPGGVAVQQEWPAVLIEEVATVGAHRGHERRPFRGRLRAGSWRRRRGTTHRAWDAHALSLVKMPPQHPRTARTHHQYHRQDCQPQHPPTAALRRSLRCHLYVAVPLSGAFRSPRMPPENSVQRGGYAVVRTGSEEG